MSSVKLLFPSALFTAALFIPYNEARSILDSFLGRKSILNRNDSAFGSLPRCAPLAAVIRQHTRKMSDEEIRKAGFDTYFVDHTAGVYPTAASGFPWTAASMQVKGNVITQSQRGHGRRAESAYHL